MYGVNPLNFGWATEALILCQRMQKNQRGTSTPKYKSRDWKEGLCVCTIEYFGPGGPKDKVLKIKSN